MLTMSDVKHLCEREPNLDDMICSLRAISKQPKKMWMETTIYFKGDPADHAGNT